MSQTTSITGYLYHTDGSAAAGRSLIVKKAAKNGTVVSTTPIIYKSDSSGYIAFNLLKESFNWLYGDFSGLDENPNGTVIYAGSGESYSLMTILSSTSFTYSTVPIAANLSLIAHTHSEYALSASLTSHTGDSSIHFTADSLNLGQYASSASLASHTGDATIHYLKSDIELGHLGDVTVTSPFQNDVLKYDTISGWVNGLGASDAGLTGVIGQLAVFSGTSTAIGLSGVRSDGSNLTVTGGLTSATMVTGNGMLEVATTMPYKVTLRKQPTYNYSEMNCAGSLWISADAGRMILYSSDMNYGVQIWSGLLTTYNSNLAFNVPAGYAVSTNRGFSADTAYVTSTASITASNQLTTKQYVDDNMKDTLKYIKTTGSSTGDIHLSDATNWNTSKANISYIRFETSSTAYTVYVLQNGNGFIIDDAEIPALRIATNAYQDQVFYLDHPYWDEDSANEVHLYWASADSSSISANIYIVGTEMK